MKLSVKRQRKTFADHRGNLRYIYVSKSRHRSSRRRLEHPVT